MARKHIKKDNTAIIEQKKKENTQYINKLLNTLPIASWVWPRILLCVLKERSISYSDDVFDPLWMIAMQGAQPLFINYSRTDLARNKIAEQLLGSDFTHVIMLDIDHAHPVDVIQKLARWFLVDKFAPENEKKNIQVVGGLNFRRSYPYDPCCHLIGKDGSVYAPAEWDLGLIEVDDIGTGSIMIAREVFETMQPPWFFNQYDQAWRDVWPGEDIGFSHKCREYGIKMYVDTTLTSPHIGTMTIGEEQFKMAMEKQGHKIAPAEGVEFVHNK